MTLLHSTLDQLAHNYRHAGNELQFETLKGFMVGDHANTTYADAAQNLGTTEEAARQAAVRMRRRYRELLCKKIAHTVETDEEVDDEIRCLFSILGNSE